MKCQNCGRQNAETNKFCGDCGKPLSTRIATQPDRNIYFFGKKIPPFLAILMGLCVCLCLAVAVASPSKQTASSPTSTQQALAIPVDAIKLTTTPTEIVLATLVPTNTPIVVAQATITPLPTLAVKPTNTNVPSKTPTRTITPVPKPTNTPRPVVPSFGEGIKVVGSDIPPGTYRSKGGSYWYWERLSGFGGSFDEIIANKNASGTTIVTIAKTDKGFRSVRCGVWTQDLSPITSSPTAPFVDGTYIVNKDIAPGRWRSSSSSGCYWERLSGFSGEFDDIIANQNATGNAIVEIGPGDAGFSSVRCGTWTKVN